MSVSVEFLAGISGILFVGGFFAFISAVTLAKREDRKLPPADDAEAVALKKPIVASLPSAKKTIVIKKRKSQKKSTSELVLQACVNCGYDNKHSGIELCAKCGLNIKTKPAYNLCSRCGSEYSGDSVECSICGYS